MRIEVNVGDIVTTKPNRKRTVKAVDGKYIYFTDGTQYAYTHPDIIKVEHKEPEPELMMEDAERPEEEKPKKKKKREQETED